MSKWICLLMITLLLLSLTLQVAAAKEAEWFLVGGNANDPVALSGINAEYQPGKQQGGGGWQPLGQFGSLRTNLQVLALDGRDDVVVTDPNPDLDISQSLFIDSWVYVTGYGEYGRIFETDGIEFFVTQTGQIKIQLANTTGRGGRSGGSKIQVTSEENVIPLKRWIRVAASYDASLGYAQLYVDGKEVEKYAAHDTFKPGNTILKNSAGPGYIGNRAALDRGLAGAIAWLYISDRPSNGPQATSLGDDVEAFFRPIMPKASEPTGSKEPESKKTIAAVDLDTEKNSSELEAKVDELSDIDITVECGWLGNWSGTITVTNGKVSEVTPIMLEPDEKITETGENYLKLQASSSNDMDGVRILARVSNDSVLVINFGSRQIEVPIVTLKEKRLLETKVTSSTIISVRLSDYDAWGKEGGRYEIPDTVVLPTPNDEVGLAGDGWDMANTIQQITLKLAVPAALSDIDFRPYPGPDGRLHVELYSPTEFIPSLLTFNNADVAVDKGAVKSLFLNLPAFIGYYEISVVYADEQRVLKVPAASIAIKGPKLYLNGDEFLSKGGLIHDGNEVQPTPATSFLMKNMGFNTVIKAEQTGAFDYIENWGFARVIKPELLNIGKEPIQSMSDAAFKLKLDSLLKLAPVYRSYITSPFVIASFLSNEVTYINGAWLSYHYAKVDEIGRLNSYLMQMNNALKEISPMMPISYANHSLGYQLPLSLDMYMHNSYYYIDRYPIPLEEYVRWQGYPDRPIYMKEFGSNTYLAEIYQGGRNNPIYGKVRQWAFEERWREYLALGSLGGSIYTVFDYQFNQPSKDHNTASFGVFTREQQSKLMTYSVWQEYVDLSVHADGTIENKRNYPLHNLQLLLIGDKQTQLINIDMLAASAKRQVLVPFAPKFWITQFETHKGLLNQQMGACSTELFQQMFGQLLDQRDNGDFLKELLPTEVMGWDGQKDHYLMSKFMQNGVIAVAFQKAPGEYYLTAWTQNKTVSAKPQTLTFYTTGDVRMLDDVTGQPLSTALNYEVKDGKLVFYNLSVPYIGQSLSGRSATEIHLPVIQVSQSNFATKPVTPLPQGIVPDQFQLSSGATISLNRGKIGQVITNRTGNISSLVVSPAANTGNPQGDITVTLCPLKMVGSPDEDNVLVSQTISGSRWDESIGKMLMIEFNVRLKPQTMYAVVFSSAVEGDNYRNLAASATDDTAMTSSYGPGRIVFAKDEGWVTAENHKQNLFFVTLAD